MNTASPRRQVFGLLFPPDEAYLARAAPEAALEPDLPIIDAHMHLWDREDASRYLVNDFARDAAESGHDVEATVFVECHAMYRADGPEHLKCVGETEFAAGMAAIGASQRYTRTRVAQAIVAHVDLRQGDLARETIEAHLAAANGRLRGTRQIAKWNADPVIRGQVFSDDPELLRSEAFGRGIDMLTSYGLSFDASVYHPQIPEVTALARAHPDANIVLIHTGSPVGHGSYAGKEAENHAAWHAAMRELAGCPNVSVKLGGVLMHLGNFDFTRAEAPPTSEQLAELWRPYVEPCIELFGAGRCMVSSNFPVDKAGFGYGTVWNMFKRITAGCSADEKRLIFGDTARRVYRL